MLKTHTYVHFLVVLSCILLLNCRDKAPDKYEWKTMEVTATAYNSLAYQTNDNPHITAFGDSLKPGLRYVAVSRDLIKMGLTHNTLIEIDGLDGTYLVKDKMHYRHRNKIDLYLQSE